MAASPDFSAAFSAVLAPAAPLVRLPAPLTSSDRLVEFIESCETVMTIAFDRPGAAELLPGVAVANPAAMLKAFLTYVACAAPNHEDPAQLAAWLARVQPHVWRAVGFKSPPPTSTVELAFSLLCDRGHQAVELRALVAAVECFASANLLQELA